MSAPDILDVVTDLRARGAIFAVATVVRTVSMTAAKAGAKAVIDADGTISTGWIGGGCARAAVLRAAREAMADGVARLISVQPEDVLAAHGHAAGDTEDGVRFARTMCPSKGTMDVFVEPMLPRPLVLVAGDTPVAAALEALLPQFGFAIGGPAAAGVQFAVVATQGRGDEAGLRAALQACPGYIGFVGSHRKAAALRDALGRDGIDASRVRSPAGLDLGAVTPEEIALSIVAEIVALRRRGQTVQQTPPR